MKKIDLSLILEFRKWKREYNIFGKENFTIIIKIIRNVIVWIVWNCFRVFTVCVITKPSWY